jgi:hypothetical protein
VAKLSEREVGKTRKAREREREREREKRESETNEMIKNNSTATDDIGRRS